MASCYKLNLDSVTIQRGPSSTVYTTYTAPITVQAADVVKFNVHAQVKNTVTGGVGNVSSVRVSVFVNETEVNIASPPSYANTNSYGYATLYYVVPTGLATANLTVRCLALLNDLDVGCLATGW